MRKQPSKTELFDAAADECNLWRTLAAAGPKSTADALEPHELERMHVAGALEEFVKQKVASGCSVILTGNAGDGKTHTMRRIASELRASNAIVEEDATARMRSGDVRPVLDSWRKSYAERRPFCMAANEYPLYLLRRAQQAADFLPLIEVDRQCRHRLAYGASSPDERAREDVLVIDLSLRNPLVPDFFEPLLNQLLNDEALIRLALGGSDPVVARNYSRLRETRVRQRLSTLLERLAALGHRATIRELWILASRLLFGTRAGLRDAKLEDWYSEVLFRIDDRFDLTSALSEVDPAQCSHPQWDVKLETKSTVLAGGWLKGPPAIPPQPTLSNMAFAALKRAFYFEHELGEEVFALADPDVEDFLGLVTRARGDDVIEKSQLVEALNAAYCPRPFASRDQYLYLWNGHRFHEQPTRSFIASERIPLDHLTLERPRLPERVEGAVPYHPDHLALSYRTVSGVVRLRVDFALYRTLRKLGRGLPRKLVPERDLHRIDAFLEQISALSAGDRRVLWSAHLEHLELLEVTLSPEGDRYERLKRHV